MAQEPLSWRDFQRSEGAAVLNSGELESNPEHIELRHKMEAGPSHPAASSLVRECRGAKSPRGLVTSGRGASEEATTMGPSFRAGATGMGQGTQQVSPTPTAPRGSAALPTSRESRPEALKDEA